MPAPAGATPARPVTPTDASPATKPFSERNVKRLAWQKRKISKIACIGAGYVGGPSSAVLAFKNPSVEVTVLDMDEERIRAWNSQSLPVYEHGLHEIVISARDGYRRSQDAAVNGLTAAEHNTPLNDVPMMARQKPALQHGYRQPNLFFSTNIKDGIQHADFVFISVNTPTKLHGVGKGFASDLGNFEAAARSIASYATDDKIIVEKSTVPCGTAETLREVLHANCKPGVQFEILSNPEFLAEGTAVSDLLNPDRVLIGSLPTISGGRAAEMLADIYAGWIPRERIITMNLWSSELSKLAANALLAQRISSINALSAVCEKTGADIDEVAYACGLDSRLGSRMLKAGPGFGGSCFKKDILSLVYMCESLHLYEVAAYWKSVVAINEYQKTRLAKRIISCLFDTVSKKKIAVLGFAYKQGTGDTRESAAIDIVLQLTAEQAHVAIYDPAVRPEQVWAELEGHGGDIHLLRKRVSVCCSPYEACSDAHAVVILTEWAEFSNKSEEPGPSSAAFDRRDIIPGLDRPTLCQSCSEDPQPTNIGPLSRPTIGNGLPSACLEHGRARLDWNKIARGMQKPRFVFDGRNILDARKLERLGFKIEAIGKMGSSHGGSSLPLQTL